MCAYTGHIWTLDSGVARGKGLQGQSALGGTFMGAAKFNLHLKIWEGKNVLRLKMFMVEEKWCKGKGRNCKIQACKKNVVKNFWHMMQKSREGGKFKVLAGRQTP